jgi:3-dehydroquinate dehydratase/shikimate dehydrogenase
LHAVHQPAFSDIVQRAPERVVLSSHDFDGVPGDLEARARDMRSSGCGVIKIAVAARRLTDTLPLIDVARDGNAVVIGMGDAGVPSRLLASRYGSRWTYAGNAVAPGQIPASQMIREFRFRDIGPATRLFGVVSSNARHSLSPVMHNAAFAAAQLDAVYVPLQAGEFDDFLQYASALGFEGASVTIPFKRDALRAAAVVDDLTTQVGAANTVRRAGNRWEATNTDVAGFLEPLEATLGQPLRGMRVAVIGGGGAARAVIVALLSRGAHVTVHTRRHDQAHEVTTSLGARIGEWPVAAGTWDVLVNCTPLGGARLRDESPLPGGPFTGRLVYDLTYGPGESLLVHEARAAACEAIDGLPMLIAQAEKQFEWWTGQKPAPGVMRDAAYERLGAVRSVRL